MHGSIHAVLRMHCVGNVVLNSCVYTVSSLSIYDCVTAMLYYNCFSGVKPMHGKTWLESALHKLQS